MDNQLRPYPYTNAQNRRLDQVFYETTGQPVFITVRAYKGSSPFNDPMLANDIVQCLISERDGWECDIYAYSLLPDHLHILGCTRADGSNVLTFIDKFKGKSTRLSWSHGCKGKLWQPRSYDHLVRKEESLLAITKYILENPVRLGLAECWEDYRWCELLDPLPL